MTVGQSLSPIARALAILLVTAGFFVASAESLPKQIDENLKTLQSKLGYLNTHTTSFLKTCTKANSCAQQDQQYMPYYTLQYCAGTSCAYQPIVLKPDNVALDGLSSHKKAIDNDIKYITMILEVLNHNTATCSTSNCHTKPQYIGVYTLVQCAGQNVSSCGPTLIPPSPPSAPTVDDLLSMIRALNVKTEAFFAACDSKVIRDNGLTSEAECNNTGSCPYCEITLWSCTKGENGCRDPLVAETRITQFSGYPANYDFTQSAQDIQAAKAALNTAVNDLNDSIANQNPRTIYYVGSSAKLGVSASCYYAEHYYSQKAPPQWTFRMSNGQCY